MIADQPRPAGRHHEAEDELIWPVLLPRIAPDGDLIATMEKQHRAIAEAVDTITAGLPAWTAHTDPAARDRLAAALRDVDAALTEHLDLEEGEVPPLVHEHLTVPEWLAPQKHAMQHGPKSLSSKLTRFKGARQYEAHRRALQS